jgi:hypothetical protein
MKYSGWYIPYQGFDWLFKIWSCACWSPSGEDALNLSDHIRHTTLTGPQACEGQPVFGITRSTFYLLHSAKSLIDNDPLIPVVSRAPFHSLYVFVLLSAKVLPIPHHSVTMSYADMAAKGPKQSPEEVSSQSIVCRELQLISVQA